MNAWPQVQRERWTTRPVPVAVFPSSAGWLGGCVALGSVSRVALAVGLVLGATCATSIARADLEPRVGVGLVGLAAPLPDGRIGPLELPSRTIGQGARLPTGGRTYGMVGFHMDFAFALDRRFLLPLVGMGGYVAVGDTRAIASSVDGSAARVTPWRSSRVDVLLPGIGIHGVKRRFAGSAVLRTGVALAFFEGHVAAGPDVVGVETNRASLLLQVELEGCRRLDPMQRVCLFVAPRLHDFGWLTGVSAGLRWELGS